MSQKGPLSEAENEFLGVNAIKSAPVLEVTYSADITEIHPVFQKAEKENRENREKLENLKDKDNTQASKDIARSFFACFPGEKSITITIPGTPAEEGQLGKPAKKVTIELTQPLGQLDWAKIAWDKIPGHTRESLAPYVAQFIANRTKPKDHFAREKALGVTQGHGALPLYLLNQSFTMEDQNGKEINLFPFEGNFSKFSFVSAKEKDTRFIMHNIQYLVSDKEGMDGNCYYRDRNGTLVKIPEEETVDFRLAYGAIVNDPNRSSNLDALKTANQDQLEITINGKKIELYPIASVSGSVQYTASKKGQYQPDKSELVVKTYTPGLKCVDKLITKNVSKLFSDVIDNPKNLKALQHFRSYLKETPELNLRDIRYMLAKINKLPKKEQEKINKILKSQQGVFQNEIQREIASLQKVMKRLQETYSGPLNMAKYETRLAVLQKNQSYFATINEKIKNTIPLNNLIKEELNYQQKKGNPESEKVYAVQAIQQSLAAQMSKGEDLDLISNIQKAYEQSPNQEKFMAGIIALLDSRRFKSNVNAFNKGAEKEIRSWVDKMQAPMKKVDKKGHPILQWQHTKKTGPHSPQSSASSPHPLRDKDKKRLR